MIKANTFCIIIPCYNEQVSIFSFTQELEVFLLEFSKRYADCVLSICFVDNNSTDDSLSMLTAYCKKNKNTSVLTCRKQGYGAALKLGFASIQADFYAFLDLDNTYPLHSFLNGFEFIRSHSYIDMVMTNRFSEMSKMPWIRNLGNRVFAKLVSLLFSAQLNDVCSGQRIIAQSKINDVIMLTENGLNFSIELTCFSLLKNWNISYVPIEYKDRTGVSKLSVVKDGLQFLKTIIKVKYFSK